MTVRLLRPYVPYLPHRKQALFLSDALNGVAEVLFGGAAGGGKSDALLMAALQYVDVPGYNALVLRRTYAELTQSGGILDRMHLWMRRLRYVEDPDGVLRLSPGQQVPPNARVDWSKHAAPGDGKPLTEWGLAHWNAGEWRYEFPSGARITFGHLQTEEAKTKYQGGEYQCICVDELTLLVKSQWTFLGTRLRQPEAPEDEAERDAILERVARGEIPLPLWAVPLRLRAGSNPGGRGHHWVKARFIGDLKKGIPPNRTDTRFVPSLLDDNPSVGKSYERMLALEDGVTYRQMRFGSWDDVVAGEYFQRDEFGMVDDWQVRGTQWEAIVRYWDLAATAVKKRDNGRDANDPDWAVGLLAAWDGYHWYVLHVARLRNDPAAVDQAIDNTALMDGVEVPVWIEQEPGSSGKMYVSQVARRLKRHAVEGHRPTGSKLARARVVSAKVRQRLVRVVRAPWNDAFFDELEDFTGVEGEDAHDDQVDALSGAFDRLGVAGAAETSDTGEPDDEDDDGWGDDDDW